MREERTDEQEARRKIRKIGTDCGIRKTRTTETMGGRKHTMTGMGARR